MKCNRSFKCKLYLDVAGSPVVVLRSGHDGTFVDTLRSDKGSPFKKERK
jgi:hypothetical protein